MALDKWPKRFLREKVMGIMQAQEEGRVHVPHVPGPGAWSDTRLFCAFGVKVTLEKMREKRVGFFFKENWTMERALLKKMFGIFLLRGYS